MSSYELKEGGRVGREGGVGGGGCGELKERTGKGSPHLESTLDSPVPG